MVRLSEDELRLADFKCRMPLAHAAPCYFWNPNDAAVRVNSGTASLLRYRNENFAITNSHVFQEYRRRIDDGEDIVFFIGNMQIDDIDDRIHSESPSDVNDLCVIRLNGIAEDDIQTGGPIRKSFFSIEEICRHDFCDNDFLMFGGYPLAFRSPMNSRSIMFGTLSSGAAAYTGGSGNRIYASLRDDNCVVVLDSGIDFPEDLGGISGSPVFLEGLFGGEIASIKFVGVVSGGAFSGGAIEIRPASLLSDGLIVCNG